MRYKRKVASGQPQGSSSWDNVARKFGEDIGVQIGKIENGLKSQVNELIGRIRIESTCDTKWFNSKKQDIIQNLKNARSTYPTIKIEMDNMTHLIIENSTGVHKIEKALWQ